MSDTFKVCFDCGKDSEKCNAQLEAALAKAAKDHSCCTVEGHCISTNDIFCDCATYVIRNETDACFLLCKETVK